MISVGGRNNAYRHNMRVSAATLWAMNRTAIEVSEDVVVEKVRLSQDNTVAF